MNKLVMILSLSASFLGAVAQGSDSDVINAVNAHRKEQEDAERLAIAEQVQRLLAHESGEGPHAASGRVSLRNTSSSVSAPTERRTSAGVPIAAMAPFTMMEMRRQYSASSR